MHLLVKRKIPWEPALIVISVTLCLAVFADPIYGDGWSYFANLESLITDGDLRLDNNLHGDLNGVHFFLKTGRWAAVFPFGTAWLQAPFFLIGKVLAEQFPWQRDHYPLGARSSAQFWCLLSILLANSLYALAGVLINFYSLIHLRFGRTNSLLTTLATFLCTPLPYYGSSFYSHSINFFLISVVFLLLVRIVSDDPVLPYSIRKRFLLLYLLGLVLSLATHVRYGNSFIFAAIFFFFSVQTLRDKTVSQIFWLAVGYLSLLWIFPLIWKVQFGSYLNYGYQTAFVWWRFPPPGINSLLSSHHGFLLWYPIHFLSFLGLWWLIRHRPGKHHTLKQTATVSLMALFAICLIYGLRTKGDNPGDFASRNLISTAPFLAVGLAHFFQEVPRKWSIMALPAILYSLCLLLLSRGHMVTPHPEMGNSTGNFLSDYLYVFQENIPIKNISNAVVENSYVLPYLFSHPIYASILSISIMALMLFFTNIDSVIFSKPRPLDNYPPEILRHE